MKKLILFFIGLLILTHLSFASSHINIKVNGKYITPDTSPFISNSTTYVPIRFISQALGITDIKWDQNSKSVKISHNNKTLTLFVNKNYAYINNEYIQLNNNALIKESRTFVPIRFISENFNTTVGWDNKENTVIINSNNPTSPENNNSTSKPTNSDLYNNYDDSVYWLSRIIEAEAGGEPFKGKVAVGEVILNRVKSKEFPNTIWEVIFDDNFGIQFEPVANGAIYNSPSNESILAAKTALEGSNYIGDCLYFLNPTIAQSNWITKNREYYTTISNHEFYV